MPLFRHAGLGLQVQSWLGIPAKVIKNEEQFNRSSSLI